MHQVSHVAAIMRNYMKTDGSTQSAAIRDIITDIIHLCDDSKVDFEERLKAARKVYDEEKRIQEIDKNTYCKQCGGKRKVYSASLGTSIPCPECKDKVMPAPKRPLG